MPVKPVNFRQRYHHAQGAAARDNCCLINRITLRKMHSHHRMPCFVIGGFFLLIRGQHHTAPLGAHHDFVLGVFKINHIDHRAPNTRRHQGRLVHQIGQISARHSRRSARNQTQVHIWPKRRFTRMDFKDFFTPVDIRIGHSNLTVKAARTQQRWVKNIAAVCGR